MTIRQYLKRRSDQYATLAVVFLLAVGIAAGYAPRILAVRIVAAILIGVVLAAAFWSLFEIPCPNCGKSMGRVGFWVGPSMMWRRLLLQVMPLRPRQVIRRPSSN